MKTGNNATTKFNYFLTLTIVLTIGFTSCTQETIEPPPDSISQDENQRGNSSITGDELVSYFTNDAPVTIDTRNLNFAIVPYFYNDYWSYCLITPSDLQNGIFLGYQQTGVANPNDIGYCGVDPEDPNNGYLPIPSIYSNVGVNDYATDPDDPNGGYLPIPSSVVSVNSNGGNYLIDENHEFGGYLPFQGIFAGGQSNDFIAARIPDIEDPNGGYLPIPNIFVNYEDGNGNDVTLELRSNAVPVPDIFRDYGLPVVN